MSTKPLPIGSRPSMEENLCVKHDVLQPPPPLIFLRSFSAEITLSMNCLKCYFSSQHHEKIHDAQVSLRAHA